MAADGAHIQELEAEMAGLRTCLLYGHLRQEKNPKRASLPIPKASAMGRLFRGPKTS